MTTQADLRNEQALRENPPLSNAVDQLTVARDNLPIGTSDTVRGEFDSLIGTLVSLAKKSQRSDADRKAEQEAAAEAAKPQ